LLDNAHVWCIVCLVCIREAKDTKFLFHLILKSKKL